MNPVSIASLHRSKWAFTTRHVRRKDIERLLPASAASEAGQLLLAEVTQLGQHDGIQLESGRRAQLYLGDRIVVCLGDRYAPDQFEGIAKIGNGQDCELLAGGGVAGVVRHRHGRMRAATGLRVLGVLGDADGIPVNIARYALDLPEPKLFDRPAIPVVVVVGSSMNAGKTTACASLIHGLARNGRRVGAVKIILAVHAQRALVGAALGPGMGQDDRYTLRLDVRNRPTKAVIDGGSVQVSTSGRSNPNPTCQV